MRALAVHGTAQKGECDPLTRTTKDNKYFRHRSTCCLFAAHDVFLPYVYASDGSPYFMGKKKKLLPGAGSNKQVALNDCAPNNTATRAAAFVLAAIYLSSELNRTPGKVCCAYAQSAHLQIARVYANMQKV